MVLGWVSGSFFVPLLPTQLVPQSWSIELNTSLFSYVCLWAACTFLKWIWTQLGIHWIVKVCKVNGGRKTSKEDLGWLFRFTILFSETNNMRAVKCWFMNGAWKQSQENYRSTVPWCSLEDRKQISRPIDFGVPNLKQSWCHIKLCLSLFTPLTILFPCLNQEHFEYPIISVFLMLSIGFWRVTCFNLWKQNQN
jgi:glycopeptide antibiotics resistance protein